MIYYIGIRESDIRDTEIFDGGSITYFGSNKNGNHSLNGTLKKSINHNDIRTDNLFNDFAKKCVENILKKDKEAKFYYYNQHFIYLQKEFFDCNFICGNDKQIIDKLNNKFFVREYLKSCAKILKYKLIQGKDISLEKVKRELGGDNFVAQQCIGNGGEGTFIFNSKTEKNILSQISLDSKYHVSNYLVGNSVSTHIIIGRDKILYFPFSLQIIKSRNDNLTYQGGDFSAYNEYISKKVDSKLKKYTENIAEKIKKFGYIGVLGIDFIATNDEAYFLEINPRFQTSSALLNTNLKAMGLPSLYLLNYDAFYGTHLTDIPEFAAKGSFLVRSYNDEHKYNLKPIQIFSDGNNNSKDIGEGAYIRTEVFDRTITDNANQFEENEIFRLKLQLMQEGIKIENETLKLLSGALYDDYVTCSGVMLKIGGNHSKIQTECLDDIYLNKREYVTASINENSKFILSTDKNGSFLIKDRNGQVITNDIGISRPMLGQKEDSCVAIHGDRIRVSLITGCSGDCKFCGLNKLKYVQNDFEKIKTEIDKILSLKGNITRLFITGGNPKEADLKSTLLVVKKLINEYSPRGISKYDFMFAPRGIDKYFYECNQKQEYVLFLNKIKKMGVTTVAIDLEMYNNKLLSKYAPFKNKIGRDNYLFMLAEAVKVFGKGNVRSNIMVGIEPLKDTIDAVESLAEIGAEPCLSPYEPYEQLPEIKKPSWKFLYEVYLKSVEICNRKDVNLAPSIYATDTHNSVASARSIPLTKTEYDSFYSNVESIQNSIKKELKNKGNKTIWQYLA